MRLNLDMLSGFGDAQAQASLFLFLGKTWIRPYRVNVHAIRLHVALGRAARHVDYRTPPPPNLPAHVGCK